VPFRRGEYFHHQQLLEVDGSAVIIDGSGMCTGGRIIDHLRWFPSWE